MAGDNITLLLFRSVVFILVLLFGIFLIRGVLREVEQREKIENLATQLAVTNDELKSTNEKLKELDKLKTEFVSMATHQLRSPLTAIKGYASMLLENSFGPVETKARGAVEIIFQSSQKLVQVIEDFLNITRIDLGTMKYEKIQFDFGALVNNVVTELKPNIEKRGLKFSLEIAPKTNFNLVGDSGKLSQVISNLIDNAIKYTPPLSTSGEPGTIRISLDRAKGKVRLTVADNGAGIPAATIPKLFQKFIRADDAGKLNITGTGLGLYVAKQIMEAHNGKIWAESDGTGRGSRFIVEV
ncbi:MAG TPA: HAMP domain-containing sensor histidine kinase [Candidatus Paceibacterota bacterium]